MSLKISEIRYENKKSAINLHTGEKVEVIGETLVMHKSGNREKFILYNKINFTTLNNKPFSAKLNSIMILEDEDS